MFEYELNVLEEVSGKSKKIAVRDYELEDSDTEMYWREHEFELPEEDDYWFTVSEIKATYFDYDDSENEINITISIDSGYQALHIEEVAEKIKMIERIGLGQLV